MFIIELHVGMFILRRVNLYCIIKLQVGLFISGYIDFMLHYKASSTAIYLKVC